MVGGAGSDRQAASTPCCRLTARLWSDSVSGRESQHIVHRSHGSRNNRVDRRHRRGHRRRPFPKPRRRPHPLGPRGRVKRQRVGAKASAYLAAGGQVHGPLSRCNATERVRVQVGALATSTYRSEASPDALILVDVTVDAAHQPGATVNSTLRIFGKSCRTARSILWPNCRST